MDRFIDILPSGENGILPYYLFLVCLYASCHPVSCSPVRVINI